MENETGTVQIRLSELNRRLRFRWEVDGTIVEYDVVVTTRQSWDVLPESRSDQWMIRAFGDLVVACQCPQL
jgi:hypothetical protein